MAHITLGTDSNGQLVTLEQVARLQGLYMPGLQGTGKSTLMLNLICQDMEAGHGLCVIDPKGDLAREVIARVPAHRLEDVIVLDPLVYTRPFGLHLFECPFPEDPLVASQTQSRVLHIFEKVWYPEGDMMTSAPQLTEVLSNLTYLLISNQDYTMAEIPRILTNQTYREPLVKRTHNSYVQQWWTQKYNMMGKRDQEEYANSTIRRVERFLQNPMLLPIVGQTKTSVQMRQVMDEGKILIVRLPVVRLGEDVVTLLGSILISQIMIAALSREDIPESQRRFFALYCDEYHRFAIEDFATLIAEGRGFGVASTVAHQWLLQLDRTNQAAVKSIVNKVVFQINPDDARELSAGFFHEPDQTERAQLRPVQNISPTPFEDLIRRGHPNPSVSRWIEAALVPVENSRNHIEVLSRQPSPEAGKPPPDRTEGILAIRHHISRINEYLTSRMMRKYERRSPEGKEAMRALIYTSGIFYFVKLTPELRELIDTAIDWRVDQTVKQARANLYDPTSKDRDPWRKVEQYFLTHHAPAMYGGDPWKWCLRVQGRIRNFLELANVLTAYPIYAQTGAMEPVYERPRAYSDVQAEVASKLAHMPIRQARVRLIQELEVREYPLSTLPPPPVPEGARDRVKAILEASGIYTRPVEEVLSEIAKRQAPPENRPPIGRSG